jgi:hypothetical protein
LCVHAGRQNWRASRTFSQPPVCKFVCRAWTIIRWIHIVLQCSGTCAIVVIAVTWWPV